MHSIRYLLYIVVIYGYSVCHAGSYDDFFEAVRKDDATVVVALLARGFDPNTPNPAGEHGLIAAIRVPSPRVASALIAWPKVNIEARTERDESPLMLAAFKGLTDLCRQLIGRDADVNRPGWTPLHYAATNGHLEVIDLLLQHHAYIDTTSPNGTTPLMMAAHYGTPQAVKLLLEAGADPDLKNDQGLSAVAFAERGGQLESVRLINAFLAARPTR